MEVFGIRLVGVNPDVGKKLAFTLALLAILLVVRAIVSSVIRVTPGRERASFWLRQISSLALLLAGALGFVSIWFDDPRRLTTGLGLMTAGLAFALQKVVTSFAGYLVILRGKSFRVGDRIVMGGVRGDVIRLDFMQTHIMEMGQPAAVEPNADPAMWVRSRQYTGRIVTVTNDRIFNEPVYNFSREFPYIWEEMKVPIPYSADRHRAEQILLDTARRHTVNVVDLGEPELRELSRRYAIPQADLHPRVYWRLTDNWLELTVRFIVTDHGIREMKDAIVRDVLAAFDQAGIVIASATFEVVGLPHIRVRMDDGGER
jgi:small-conductance mechanosensitive channel